MASAGVVTAAEVSGGMNIPSGNKGFDFSSPTTWAVVFVILALLYLFVG